MGKDATSAPVGAFTRHGSGGGARRILGDAHGTCAWRLSIEDEAAFGGRGTGSLAKRSGSFPESLRHAREPSGKATVAAPSAWRKASRRSGGRRPGSWRPAPKPR